MTEHVVAVDIDLRQFAAWSSNAGQLFAEANFKTALGLLVSLRPTTVLIEIASPHAYVRAQQKKRTAWTIYNAAMALRLNDWLQHPLGGDINTVLVAPSSTWTKGMPEKLRHRAANVVEPAFPRAKGRHDLKECQAMIWTYRAEPKRWKPLEQYLEEL